MKRFLILLSLLFCNTVCADIINLRFVNEDNTIYENKTCTVGGDVVLPSTTPSKRGYNFVGWKIPQYIPIEYLENDQGKTYINTGYIANNDTKIVADFIGVKFEWNASCYIVHSDKLSIKGNYGYGSADADKGISCIFGNSNSAQNIGNRDRRKVVLSKEGYSVNNGETVSFSTAPDGFNTSSLVVFSRDSRCVNRIYSIQIYQNNILVHDYVPALDLAGIAGLYDKVDEVFLYNAGSGEFVAGPIIDYD